MVSGLTAGSVVPEGGAEAAASGAVVVESAPGWGGALLQAERERPKASAPNSTRVRIVGETSGRTVAPLGSGYSAPACAAASSTGATLGFRPRPGASGEKRP